MSELRLIAADIEGGRLAQLINRRLAGRAMAFAEPHEPGYVSVRIAALNGWSPDELAWRVCDVTGGDMFGATFDIEVGYASAA
jgi:hypothetical protein